MAFNGVRLFRYALLGEAALNIASAIPIIMFPDWTLSQIVRGPSQITPATRTLIQLFGGIVLGITAPLLLSYANVPRASAARHTTYTTYASVELALSAISLAAYFGGDSGFTDNFLVIGAGSMGLFLAVRAFFLFVRPSWMEAQENAKKVN